MRVEAPLAGISKISVAAREDLGSLLELPRQLEALQPRGRLVADFCSAGSALVYCNRVCSASGPAQRRCACAAGRAARPRRLRWAVCSRPWWSASAREGCPCAWRA